MDKFAVFILTHGRPDNVITYDTLMKQGYTGKVYLIIDDEDKKGDEYIERFGSENVIKFSKSEIAKTFDESDNFTDRRSIVYARNASYEIARSLGIQYFIQFDDDYTVFFHAFTEEKEEFLRKPILNLDKVFKYYFDYLKSIPAISIAFAQGGDFIWGAGSKFAYWINCRRKCMNSFFCNTEKPVKFFWRLNEDVNVYTTYGQRGDLLLTIPNVVLNQKQTQTNAGGMSDIYKSGGTYQKSFYSVMSSPSCVKVYEMGRCNKRIHHRIKWAHTVPKIIREVYKK